MSDLFQPYEFSGIRMRNRFVRSATVNNLTNEENRFTPAPRKLYTDLPLLSLAHISRCSPKGHMC